jgi:putative addiction module killer protein
MQDRIQRLRIGGWGEMSLIDYNLLMFAIKTTDEFDNWLDGLRDRVAQRRIVARLRKASAGLLGDVSPVGQGVSEMREHFGLGYRIYFKQYGNVLIVVLAGGNKSTQAADIALALKLAKQL